MVIFNLSSSASVFSFFFIESSRSSQVIKTVGLRASHVPSQTTICVVAIRVLRTAHSRFSHLFLLLIRL